MWIEARRRPRRHPLVTICVTGDEFHGSSIRLVSGSNANCPSIHKLTILLVVSANCQCPASALTTIRLPLTLRVAPTMTHRGDGELTPIEFEDQLMDIIERDQWDDALRFADERFDETWPIPEQLRLMTGVLSYLAMATAKQRAPQWRDQTIIESIGKRDVR